MSNPVVTVKTNIPYPTDPTTTRKSYMLRVFDAVNFFLYKSGESASSYDPTGMGQEFYQLRQIGQAVGVTPPPEFVTWDTWPAIQVSPSVFITPNKSVMPKILTPSTLLVDNGITMEQQAYSAHWNQGGNSGLLFNWNLGNFNGSPAGGANWFKNAQVGANFGSQYVSVKAKDDASASNMIDMNLQQPASLPTGDFVSTSMIGGGAFMLMLNIIGNTPGQASPPDNEENRWSIVIEFGEVTMTIADASTMKVKIGDEETSVNLAEGAAKEGPPQAQHMADKAPYLIGVYPCWNGIVVTSGSQETPEVTKTASTFCRKHKDVTIQSADYGSWFNPHVPQNVEVGTGSGGSNVLVDMGSSIQLTAKNCRYEVAYLPRFFSRRMEMDGWIMLADDTDDITYTYRTYTIFTTNGNSDYVIGLPNPVQSSYPGSSDGTHYYYISWYMEADKYQRWAPEIFGYILETTELRQYSIKNRNGAFALEWGGTQTPADPLNTNWKNHIKSVSCTTSIDGSSGQITVDKFGCAGQQAVAVQNIGGIILEAYGGENTEGGEFFYGLAMGIAEAASNADATWTIPLIGLEKKMDDIALINPPFVDGEPLAEVVDFLCKYAGINYDLSDADATVVLSVTEEINSARFDWKTGTSVRTALEDALKDVQHWYCVRDGVVFIYELGTNGLPVNLGPDRSGNYSIYNIVNIDRTPDFEDLRNYIVVMALQKVPEGQGTDIATVPTLPMIEARTKETTPDVPWARCLVQALPGTLDQAQLATVADRLSNMSTVYEVTGKLTIAGNAKIKPYDQWGEYVIYSVTHNLDLEAKTWITDLEFMRNAT